MTVAVPSPIVQTAFNLVVCCYALGDKEGMRQAFARLLQVRSEVLGHGPQSSLLSPWHDLLVGSIVACTFGLAHQRHSECMIHGYEHATPCFLAVQVPGCGPEDLEPVSEDEGEAGEGTVHAAGRSGFGAEQDALSEKEAQGRAATRR